MLLKGLDTETTGIPDFKARSADPKQPRVCSIATVTADHNGNFLEKKKVFIKPDGWTVSQFTIDHGITQEMCEDLGVPIKDIYEEIDADAHKYDFFVAHNSTFDMRMMKIEAARLGLEDIWPNKWHCTMRQATPIVKCPPTANMLKVGFNSYKAPSLQEAYQHFFGKQFDGAHDAGADIEATMKIFFAMNPPEKVAA